VVRDGEQVHLFDDRGLIVAGGDIEDDSAPSGRQPLLVDGKSTGFLDEWTDGFYSNEATDLASTMPGAGASPAQRTRTNRMVRMMRPNGMVRRRRTTNGMLRSSQHTTHICPVLPLTLLFTLVLTLPRTPRVFVLTLKRKSGYKGS